MDIYLAGFRTSIIYTSQNLFKTTNMKNSKSFANIFNLYSKILLFAFICCNLQNLKADYTGKVVIRDIKAISLENNLIGEPTMQPLAIYLPPTYESNTEKSYPVLYFLPGFEDTISAYTKGYISNYFFDKSMNFAITNGKCKEVIVVIVNGYNLLTGSFFTNSPVTGNWEDFVVKDVISYMDSNFRTIPQKDGRGIFGLSMGGYAALHIAMKYPDKFCCTIGECPGLLAKESDLMNTALFNDPSIIKNVAKIKQELSALSPEAAKTKYLDTIMYFKKKKDWKTMFNFAYASSFAPNTSVNAPWFDYPFSVQDGNLVKDNSVFSKFYAGFGQIEEKVFHYQDSLKKLKGIVVDYGTNDYWKWINDGCIMFNFQLNKYNIPNLLWSNSGGHGNLHKSRTENNYLPYFNNMLEFDTLHLNNQNDILAFSCTGQEGNSNIDPVAKQITLRFRNNMIPYQVVPTVTISPGAWSGSILSKPINLTAGEFNYSIIAENGVDTAKWKIVVDKSSPIDNTNAVEVITVYPNPVSNMAFVKSHFGVIDEICVFNANGRLVYKKTDMDAAFFNLNMSNFLPGYYIMICGVNGHRISRKIKII